MYPGTDAGGHFERQPKPGTRNHPKDATVVILPTRGQERVLRCLQVSLGFSWTDSLAALIASAAEEREYLPRVRVRIPP